MLLGTDDDVYIIDPEREYTPLAEIFGGEVIRIALFGYTYQSIRYGYKLCR